MKVMLRPSKYALYFKLWLLCALLAAFVPAYATGSNTAAGALAPEPTASSSQQLIVTKVTLFLEQQASSYPGLANVTVDPSRAERFPDCTSLQVFLPTGQKLRSNMSVGVRCTEPEQWNTRVRTTLTINGFFYVANRIIEPGESLSLDDLIAREGDILSLPRGVVVDPSQLIDQIATQRIPSGSPIKSSSLRNPMSVLRGQVVRMEARGDGFVVTSEGQTLQDGAPGEQIRIRTSSGQVVTATVLNSNTVVVPM